jgi:hypothetical protein
MIRGIGIWLGAWSLNRQLGEAIGKIRFAHRFITVCKCEPAAAPSDDLHRFLIETILRLLEKRIFTSIDYAYDVGFP